MPALTPAFDPATQSYTAMVGNSVASVTVTATVADDSATVTVNGLAVASGSPGDAIDLEAGENVITVEVTTGDGSHALLSVMSVCRSSDWEPSVFERLAQPSNHVSCVPGGGPQGTVHSQITMHSILRYPDGTIGGGRYLNDQRTGNWVERDRYGGVEEGSYGQYEVVPGVMDLRSARPLGRPLPERRRRGCPICQR